MSDAQTAEREKTWQGVAHTLEAELAKECLKTRHLRIERDALLYQRSTEAQVGPLYDGVLARAFAAEERLAAVRKYVTEALGTSQMMKPVSLVLRRVLAILDGENPEDVKEGAK
jgi:hypothetical protein